MSEYDQVIDQYGWKINTREHSDGQWCRHNDTDRPEIQQASSEGRLWSVVECEGTWELAHGYHIVNVDHYLISTTPAKAEHVDGIFADDYEGDL